MQTVEGEEIKRLDRLAGGGMDHGKAEVGGQPRKNSNQGGQEGEQRGWMRKGVAAAFYQREPLIASVAGGPVYSTRGHA